MPSVEQHEASISYAINDDLDVLTRGTALEDGTPCRRRVPRESEVDPAPPEERRL